MNVHDRNKTTMQPKLAALCAAAHGERRRLMDEVFWPDAVWHAPHPLPGWTSLDRLEAELWRPLKLAFPDLERRDDMVFAGRFRDDDWVTCHGHYLGNFAGSWLGIPATGGIATLRFGEFHLIREGRVAEVRMLLDIVDLMRQAGVNPLPRPPGVEGLVPPPATRDGISSGPRDDTASAASLALVETMIFRGLAGYDGVNQDSVDMRSYWADDMGWYGPGGIGSNRGIPNYRRCHQIPFLTAFPDRVGGNHRARFADGNYVASTGWPSVSATFAGDYLGVKAPNRRIGMRVMDWWRVDGGRLKENWVLIDIPDLLRQAGFDVFAHLQVRSA